MASASGVTVGTTVDLRALENAFQTMADRARDATSFWRAVVEPDMSALLEKQFASGGSTMRQGHRWKQLLAATVAKKVRQYGTDRGVLVASGYMRDAFVNPSHPDAVAIVQQLRYIRSVKGEAKRIADYHQTGTTRGLPARPVMGDGVPQPVRRAWSSQLAHWIARGAFPTRSAVT